MRWFDAWSIAHLAFGLWAGDRKWSLGKLLLVHTAWEVFEATVCERHLNRAFPWAFYGEPLSDRIGDTACATAGWLLTRDRGPRRNPQARSPLLPGDPTILKHRDFLVSPQGDVYGMLAWDEELLLPGFGAIFADSTPDDDRWVLVYDPREWQGKEVPRPRIWRQDRKRPTPPQRIALADLAAFLKQHGGRRHKAVAQELEVYLGL